MTLLPYRFAKQHGLLLNGEEAGKSQVYGRQDCTPAALTELRRFLNSPITLTLIDDQEFDTILRRTYESSGAEALQAVNNLSGETDLASIAQELAEPEDLLESQDDAPIIRLINGLLTEAVKENASDIHIEPFEHRLRVRFRVDGVLRQVLEPAAKLAPLLVSRIKVMARLDIAEKRLPQDGRISLKIAGRPVDVRVSTIPSGYGERVVMRLLDKETGRLDLSLLGMKDELRHRIQRLIQRPNGIILVTGPTGSGKTTTLYAMLNCLNQTNRNILTVEDPIEYYLDGIGQTQVNYKTEMTFARGLRAILRQDPDIVMIGEIRDIETAKTAVQASLTGHLVLSTLHTNTAAGAIIRLQDMGVEPYLLASSLEAVLAQRLVRLLCPDCREIYTPSHSEYLAFAADQQDEQPIYRPNGCKECCNSGYRGRTGIYELLEINEIIRGLIHNNGSEQEIKDGAKQFTTPIIQDGWQRIVKGDTSIEEVLRVSGNRDTEQS